MKIILKSLPCKPLIQVSLNMKIKVLIKPFPFLQASALKKMQLFFPSHLTSLMTAINFMSYLMEHCLQLKNYAPIYGKVDVTF